MACIPRMVNSEIGRDSVKPGTEAGLCAISFARTIDTEEDLLGQFLGYCLIMDHAIHEVDNGLAILLNQVIEASHITGAKLQHNGGVVHLGKFAGRVMVPVCPEIFKKRRADCERCHISANPVPVP